MSKLQKIIIPRNWLFGRLSYINANLKNLVRNKKNFTQSELHQLNKAQTMISDVIQGKTTESDYLTKLFKQGKI